MPSRVYGKPFPELSIRVGPYRLFDLVAGGMRLDCRVCDRHIRREIGSALRHKGTELRLHTEGELKAVLQFRLNKERSLKRRKEVQFRYASNPENVDKP